MAAIVIENVWKIYPGTPPVEAVREVSFSLPEASFAILMGPSGSGKTTLLNLISSLDQPTRGDVWLGGERVTGLSPAALTRLRRDRIGFIFQSFNLFPTLTALENVAFTLDLRGRPRAETRARAQEALALVGLHEHGGRTPGQLSGGQQQRVAVARALAGGARVVFADEPTANLDSPTAFLLIELFERLNRERGVTFLFSTHDQRLAGRGRQKLTMEDGRLRTDA